ncbi:uncharacterized protein MONOS_7457 [Monocercomonoides exilis]|uniref:uncharacterized protein n=1 Tax=Monocercomonoides exilis TaxID=2049356 RepID=UPI0035595A81|nr:hypothetical protein MONOS_7457 [Monocercomonoides exilis]|eukprot:MONOS_7457.1-p1 / transcript=MONOS_7457.1 / gene=MONOS_7457 / organism=Monocercomonoides_exilis_PA203 / gene_product=unspecified product / transcript_product=unspecified product / location=Mono_scaffold00255:36730-40611(-) / protein_length=1256 / sequence_SO=supercontig / SO=protein_coding / is_pseudo=false
MLNEENKNLKEISNKLENEYKMFKHEAEDIQSEDNERIKILVSDLQEQKQKIEELTKKRNQDTEEINDKQKKIEELQKLLLQTEESRRMECVEKETQMKEKEKLRAELDNCKKTHREELEEWENERVNLVNKYSELKEGDEFQIRELQASINELRINEKKMENALDGKQVQIESLTNINETNMEEIKKNNQKIKQFEDERRKLQQEIKEKDRRNEEVEEQKQKLEYELTEKSKQIGKLKGEVQKIENEMKMAEDTIENLTGETNVLKKVNVDKENELEIVQLKIKKEEKVNEELKRELKKAEERYERMKEEKDRQILMEQVKAEREEIKKNAYLPSNSASLAGSVDLSIRHNSEESASFEALHLMFVEAQQKVIVLEEEREHLNRTIQALKEQQREAEDENEKFRDILSESEAGFHKMRTVISDTNTKLEEAIEKVDSWQSETERRSLLGQSLTLTLPPRRSGRVKELPARSRSGGSVTSRKRTSRSLSTPGISLTSRSFSKSDKKKAKLSSFPSASKTQKLDRSKTQANSHMADNDASAQKNTFSLSGTILPPPSLSPSDHLTLSYSKMSATISQQPQSLKDISALIRQMVSALSELTKTINSASDELNMKQMTPAELLERSQNSKLEQTSSSQMSQPSSNQLLQQSEVGGISPALVSQALRLSSPSAVSLLLSKLHQIISSSTITNSSSSSLEFQLRIQKEVNKQLNYNLLQEKEREKLAKQSFDDLTRHSEELRVFCIRLQKMVLSQQKTKITNGTVSSANQFKTENEKGSIQAEDEKTERINILRSLLDGNANSAKKKGAANIEFPPHSESGTENEADLDPITEAEAALLLRPLPANVYELNPIPSASFSQERRATFDPSSSVSLAQPTILSSNESSLNNTQQEGMSALSFSVSSQLSPSISTPRLQHIGSASAFYQPTSHLSKADNIKNDESESNSAKDEDNPHLVSTAPPLSTPVTSKKLELTEEASPSLQSPSQSGKKRKKHAYSQSLTPSSFHSPRKSTSQSESPQKKISNSPKSPKTSRVSSQKSRLRAASEALSVPPSSLSISSSAEEEIQQTKQTPRRKTDSFDKAKMDSSLKLSANEVNQEKKHSFADASYSPLTKPSSSLQYETSSSCNTETSNEYQNAQLSVQSPVPLLHPTSLKPYQIQQNLAYYLTPPKLLSTSINDPLSSPADASASVRHSSFSFSPSSSLTSTNHTLSPHRYAFQPVNSIQPPPVEPPHSPVTGEGVAFLPLHLLSPEKLLSLNQYG